MEYNKSAEDYEDASLGHAFLGGIVGIAGAAAISEAFSVSAPAEAAALGIVGGAAFTLGVFEAIKSEHLARQAKKCM